ncbi:MAG: hypothetical protein ACYDEV_10215 [Acidiferrobacter sp.]
MSYGNWQLSSGQLYRSPRFSSGVDRGPVFVDRPSRKIIVHPVPSDHLDYAKIETILLSDVRTIDVTRWRLLRLRYGSIILMGTPFIALSILLILGTLHTFEESFYESLLHLTDGASLSDFTIALATSFVILFCALLFSPAAIKTENLDPRDKVRAWLSGESRASKRLGLLVKTLLRKAGPDTRVELWNVSDIEPWVIKAIAHAADQGGVGVSLYLSAPSVREFEEKMFDRKAQAPTIRPTSSQYQHDLVQESHTPMALRLSMLDSLDKRLLPVLALSAIRITDQRYLASIPLMRALASRMPSVDGATQSVVTRFIDHVTDDCGLAHRKGGLLELDGTAYGAVSHGTEVGGGLMEAYALMDRMVEERSIDETFDAYAITIVTNFAVMVSRRRHDIRVLAGMLNDALLRVRAEESYILVGPMTQLVSRYCLIVPGGSGTGGLLTLSPKALDALLFVYERYGDVRRALAVADILTSINTVEYLIRKARLLERLGRYDDAASLLAGLDDEQDNKLVRDAEGGAAFCIEYSWLLVNRKREGDDSHAKRLLFRAWTALQGIDKGNGALPTYLWRYWNNWYNLYEWAEEYDAGLRCLQRCMRIPGIDLKWRSGTFVNLGIVYRKLWLLEKTDPNLIRQALGNGRLGFSMKVRLGDFDEVPVSGYHLALSMLEFASMPTRIRHHYLRRALVLAYYAQKVLEQIGSEKKKADIAALCDRLRAFVSADQDQRCAQTASRWVERFGVPVDKEAITG